VNKLNNYGVTIYLKDNDKTDLIHILEIIGEIGKTAVWKISYLDCLGEKSDNLHYFSDNHIRISGRKLYQLFSEIYQTIEGEFVAFESDNTKSFLTIRAINGSEFDVETIDTEILERIRKSFDNVKDLIY
jgi:hypothetical protein